MTINKAKFEAVVAEAKVKLVSRPTSHNGFKRDASRPADRRH
jgi:hypothetical protein